jgi:dipeptidyl aminopeptidase/acylaminoacyl peptidase
MTCPCSRSRFRWLRRFCSFLGVLAGCCSLPASRAQNPATDRPSLTIDEDITAFAFGPDGRIVYAVNQPFKTKQYDLEHDDIWIQDANGKRRRIFVGDKFTRGNTPFTYSVNSFRWSPNGHLILAELFTTTIDETGKTQDSTITLVFEDNGKQVRLGSDGTIKDSDDPSWLLDNATVVYLSEALKPRILFSFKYVNITGGPPGPVFEGRTFLGASFVPHSNLAIAVERDRNLTGPPRLQRLELLAQDDRELATLDGYGGGISVSPRGRKVAYYIDKEVLEIRDLTDPNRFARVRCGFGVFHWAPDETRVLLKRSPEKKSGDIVWIDLPQFSAASEPVKRAGDSSPSQSSEPPVSQPVPMPILRDLTFRDFTISPDGRLLGVISLGKRKLIVYPLS